MDVVIKGTKTIEEFKQVKASMEERAERYSRRHIASCEHWQDGYPVKCWRGSYGSLSIRAQKTPSDEITIFLVM